MIKINLSIIVAMAKNRVIGINNQLPWRLPEDLKYFKTVTMNKPIVMGRKTFESMPKALPNRTNVIITRKTDYKAENAIVVKNNKLLNENY